MSAISKQQKVRGENFIHEAEATLKKKTWFQSGSDQKNEDAAELYQKAANAFKVGGAFNEAGDAYIKAANIYLEKLKNVMEGSTCMTQAGHAYKKVDSEAAINAYRSAISHLCNASRLTQAAKLSKEVAELYENQENDQAESVNLAIESYQQAAELFDMEQQNSQSSQCLLKVAELCSAALDPADLTRAAEIYNSQGKSCLESNLLKYHAKGHFLHCIMCHLANEDSVGAEQAMSRFSSLDFTFGESREGKFAGSLIECVENFDSAGFATACFEFDRITKLDPWKTSILVKIKNSIDGVAGGGEDEEGDVDLT
jgi:alpha-soluble NSF attachment protein